MPVLNYTTTIAASKTVGEMQAILAKHGAHRIITEYAGGQPSGITFQIETPHGPRTFTLPVNVDAMHLLLRKQFRNSPAKSSRAQAERVAWRVMKDWLAAQLALVETQMAQMDQVMLPYVHTDEIGTTLYDAYTDNARRMIEA